MFFQDELELWCTTHIIGREQHKLSLPSTEGLTLCALCPPECVETALSGSSRATIIHNLTELADRSGFLYDPKDLEQAILDREEHGSTNIGNGVAIPHTLNRDEGFFSESFLCIARLARPAYFNSAPDGMATDFLFLCCALTSEEHLVILSRIASVCERTEFLAQAQEAESSEEILEALQQAENNLLRGKK